MGGRGSSSGKANVAEKQAGATTNLNLVKKGATPSELHGIEKFEKEFGTAGQTARGVTETSPTTFIKEPVKITRDDTGRINYEFSTIRYLGFEKSAVMGVGDTPAQERVTRYTGWFLKGSETTGRTWTRPTGKTISETTVKGKVYYDVDKKAWSKIPKQK